ncbi:DUF1697 domain-containing protein [Flavobacterium selenitireducens]|uniref:DUF1697 domain-containing protein n=1 Tax=Flavobacterium selenitireducens TaxID=2722704 RepID=UPI001CC31467|nr:DUF1697 domain-containing protein [Flavobacterium selenitireducens]
MKKYIALLRGINVSGQKLIKMERLRESVATLGFEDVSTYIQSGNILFRYPETDVATLSRLISKAILSDFGFDVSVISIEAGELETAIAENPFSERTPENSPQPYVGFLSEIPSAEAVAALKESDFANDEFRVIGKRIYIWYGDSAGKTKLSNTVIERKLKVVSTARNWRTVHKLLELSS